MYEASESGHMLELMICPGDLLFLQDQPSRSAPASVQWLHAPTVRICVVMAVPLQLPRSCGVTQKFEAIVPSCECSEFWLICVLEWSNEMQRLHKAQKVFYVEKATRRLVLVGEADQESSTEHAPVELRQSPAWLRAKLRTDLVCKALDNMSSPLAAEVVGTDKALKPFQDAWQCEASSSCVGVVVTFW